MFQQSETDDITSDDQEQLLASVSSQLTPHKKRRRLVRQDLGAKEARQSDQRRVREMEERRRAVMKKSGIEGVSNSDPNNQTVSFNEPVINLHPHIGAMVKPHQLAGVQFMWRELILDKKRQGCLLALTMGLGKTMQV